MLAPLDGAQLIARNTPLPTHLLIIMPNFVDIGQTVKCICKKICKNWARPAFQGHSTDKDRSGTHNFLLVTHSNREPIFYYFRDKWQFRVFKTPAEEIHLEFCDANWV